MKKPIDLIAAFVMFAAVLFAPPSVRAEHSYLTGVSGRSQVIVAKDWDSMWRFSKAEEAAWHRNLQTILDIIQSQPRLKDRVENVDVKGWLRSFRSAVCGEKYCPDLPVAGQGYMYFHLFFPGKNGKPFPGIEPDGTSSFYVNEVDAFLPPFGWLNQDKGERIFYEPQRSGELEGFPLYRIDSKDVLVLTRRTASPWIPLTREAFLVSEIRAQEKDLEKNPLPPPPSDMYKKWLEEKPARERERKESYEALRQINPAMAADLLKSAETVEADMTAFYRKESEKGGQSIFPGGFSPLDRLERHRQALKAMSPAERKMPARYLENPDDLQAPYLAPAGSSEGRLLVLRNPAYFDKKLERTAIQLFAVTFPEPAFASSMIDDPGSPSFNMPSLVLQRHVREETDWKAVYRNVIK